MGGAWQSGRQRRDSFELPTAFWDWASASSTPSVPPSVAQVAGSGLMLELAVRRSSAPAIFGTARVISRVGSAAVVLRRGDDGRFARDDSHNIRVRFCR